MSESKIKFVRKYDFYNHECYEVVYNSHRCVAYFCRPIPKTVKDFITGKTPHEQYDKVFKRTEFIYE